MTSKRKKVLSIDMDYIMGPSIELYNDLIGAPEFEKMDFWEKVNELKDMDSFLRYDEEGLINIAKLVATKIKGVSPENIFFAKEHDMILELLCGDPAKADEIFDVFNIDHHHDIHYGERQKEETRRFDFASLANWVYYLGCNNKILEYHWLRTPLSRDFPIEEICDLNFSVHFDDKFETLFDIEFDYIFVCMSSDYFPKKFHHFFYLIKSIADGYFDKDFEVWKTPYCVDGKSRHVAR